MLLQLQVWAFYLLQEEGIGWDPRSLWAQMGPLAKIVVVSMLSSEACVIAGVIWSAANIASVPSGEVAIVWRRRV